ncbi:MAG: hypothetical protein Kow0059_06570 [Candidatus Sumerlaeia bacterium]
MPRRQTPTRPDSPQPSPPAPLQPTDGQIMTLRTGHFVSFLSSIHDPEARRELLRRRCRRDVALFAVHFFPHLCRLPFSRLHRDVLRRYRDAIAPDVLSRRGHNEVIAAPRGAAKTTLKALILPIHAICYGFERYIVIICATLAQARRRLRNIQNELRTNARLIEVYGRFETPGSPWNRQSLTTRGVTIDVFSAGTEMRGATIGAFRPTLIVLDDVEDSEAVECAEQRAKLRRWFHEVVENLGDSFTRLEVIGTLLHPDSLLRGLLARPDFWARSYPAVRRWADDAALWAEWRRLYTNLADPDRLQTAREFFNAHRNRMLQGTSVLWSAKEDYYSLMEQLVTRGRRAFFKEKQNDPAGSDDRLFHVEAFTWFELSGGRLLPAPPHPVASRTVPPGQTPGAGTLPPGGERTAADGGANPPRAPQNPKPPVAPSAIPSPSAPSSIAGEVKVPALAVFGFLDPALGGDAGRGGDFAAIAVVGRDCDGVLYVLDVWRRRCPPTEQVARVFDLHERWGFTAFGVEANVFQQLMALPIEQEADRRRRAGSPAARLPLRMVAHHTAKQRRILALEPLAANGWLRFHNSLPRDVVLEFMDFPRSAHDDALDAIAAAVELARESASVREARPASLRSAARLRGF